MKDLRPFVFKLETLLDIRKRREEEANLLLFQARERLRVARGLLTLLQTRQREAWDEFRAKQAAGELVVIEFQYWYKYLDFLEKQIAKQQATVDRLAAEAAAALKAAEKAMKDRKSVDKLKERRLEQYKLDVLLEEQKILDEIAITRYKRQEEA